MVDRQFPATNFQNHEIEKTGNLKSDKETTKLK